MSSGFSMASVIALRDALKSQASQLGIFRDRVLGHEPKSSPGNGVTCAIWLGPIVPISNLSGLSASAGRATWTARIYVPWEAQSGEDEDKVETTLMHATLELIAAYSAHFTLGSEIFAIDLLGAYGEALTAANVGYIEVGGKHYRAAELTIPVLIDNLYTQAA